MGSRTWLVALLWVSNHLQRPGLGTPRVLTWGHQHHLGARSQGTRRAPERLGRSGTAPTRGGDSHPAAVLEEVCWWLVRASLSFCSASRTGVPMGQSPSPPPPPCGCLWLRVLCPHALLRMQAGDRGALSSGGQEMPTPRPSGREVTSGATAPHPPPDDLGQVTSSHQQHGASGRTDPTGPATLGRGQAGRHTRGGSRTRVEERGAGKATPGRRPEAPSPSVHGGRAAPGTRCLASVCPPPLPSGFSSIGPARRAPAPNMLRVEGSSLPTITRGAHEGPASPCVSGPPTAKPVLPARKGQREGNSWAACACALMGVIISPALHPETGAMYIIYGGLGLRSRAGRPLAHS